MKHLTNSTLGRKPGNDMKSNMGREPVRSRADQSGDGADFAFNGQMGDGVNRSKSTDCYSYNQQSGHSNDGRLINKGMGPRTGNASSSPQTLGAPKKPLTIATAAQGHNIGAAVMPKSPANPNKINVGAGPRKGNM